LKRHVKTHFVGAGSFSGEANYMESFAERLKRYTTQSDLEIFGWMTVMMQNSFLSELRIAAENRLYVCLFLYTHAIMQTISENMFGQMGSRGTKFYLENFVDGAASDRQFSRVSDEIHEMRNVFAHLGYSSLQHRIDLNDEMAEGWKMEVNTICINPRIYAEQFAEAFERGAQVNLYCRSFSEVERVIRKYVFIRKWLGLDKLNPITREIKKLEAFTVMADIRIQEIVIQDMITKEYGLT
jgi:hypothetical protein